MAESDQVERNFRVTNNNAIDMHVGKRIRLRRTLLGMSQEQLGSELDITFQQVQKYESGKNGTSSIRLVQISEFFNKPLNYFTSGVKELIGQVKPPINNSSTIDKKLFSINNSSYLIVLTSF